MSGQGVELPVRARLRTGPGLSGGLTEPGRGRVRLAQRGGVHVQLRVVRLRLDAELVGAVLAEPVDALGQVRRDVSQVLRLDRPALLQQLADDLGDVQGIVEDRRVREQMEKCRFAVYDSSWPETPGMCRAASYGPMFVPFTSVVIT
ncbi:hypothetical protein [Streptomyces sp. B5E4]|uniref:hypothetical protein n=1 Tax=Streptomyces sp. B5E4 TaxID=3153568 RepID=UPI00325FC5BB